jgi:hypothetical protein
VKGWCNNQPNHCEANGDDNSGPFLGPLDSTAVVRDAVSRRCSVSKTPGRRTSILETMARSPRKSILQMLRKLRLKSRCVAICAQDEVAVWS